MYSRECRMFAFRSILGVIFNWDSDNDDPIFEYLLRNRKIISDFDFIKYSLLVAKIPFYDEEENKKWLLDFYYSIYDNKFDQLESYINLETDKPKNFKNKENECYLKSYGNIIDSIRKIELEKEEIILISTIVTFTDDTLSLLIERYPSIMIVILKFFYPTRNFNKVVDIIIEKYRYTATYKRLISKELRLNIKSRILSDF